MPTEKIDPVSILEDLQRCGLDPADIDLEWMCSVRDDAARAIEQFRNEPEFAAALPASSIWPELLWQMRRK
jgi:hypothetical protein